MPSLIKSLLLGSLLALAARATEPAAQPPWATSALSVESGVLWEIGTGTTIAYRLVPTQLSWRSKEVLEHIFADGSRIVVRHRLTLIGTWIENGPESHYVGVSGSPSIEWWNPAGDRKSVV